MNYIGVSTGDCLELTKALPDEWINLIPTSPPYANQRLRQYGGIDPDRYVDWFLPISAELYRVLKFDGSFVLNIKEHVEDGERHEYVFDLVKALRRQGWRWIDTFIWNKLNPYPGFIPGRFRDGWEYCFHLTKSKYPGYKIFKDEVKMPIGEWIARESRLMRHTVRVTSATGSGFGRRNAAWFGKDSVFPTNVFHSSVSSYNCGHSAAFPPSLPEFFIRFLTAKYDWVLDPFCGSNTTGEVCDRLERNYVGYDIAPVVNRRGKASQH